MFFKGLKPTVKTTIMLQGCAKTFDALWDQGIHFNQHQHLYGWKKPRKQSRTHAPSPETKGQCRNPPMNHEARSSRFQRKSKNGGKCSDSAFGCGEASHSSRNCKKKPQPDTADEPPKEHMNHVFNMAPIPPCSLVSCTYQPTPITPSNWQSQPHSRSESRDMRN